MPNSYQLQVGGSTYEVQSDNELSPDQLRQAALHLSGGGGWQSGSATTGPATGPTGNLTPIPQGVRPDRGIQTQFPGASIAEQEMGQGAQARQSAQNGAEGLIVPSAIEALYRAAGTIGGGETWDQASRKNLSGDPVMGALRGASNFVNVPGWANMAAQAAGNPVKAVSDVGRGIYQQGANIFDSTLPVSTRAEGLANSLGLLYAGYHGVRAGMGGGVSSEPALEMFGPTEPPAEGMANRERGGVPGARPDLGGVSIADQRLAALQDFTQGNLHMLERVDPDLASQARETAGARSQAKLAYGEAQRAVDAIYGDGYFNKSFMPALTEDNIVGRKARLAGIADEFANASPDDVAGLVDKHGNLLDSLGLKGSEAREGLGSSSTMAAIRTLLRSVDPSAAIGGDALADLQKAREFSNEKIDEIAAARIRASDLKLTADKAAGDAANAQAAHAKNLEYLDQAHQQLVGSSNAWDQARQAWEQRISSAKQDLGQAEYALKMRMEQAASDAQSGRTAQPGPLPGPAQRTFPKLQASVDAARSALERLQIQRDASPSYARVQAAFEAAKAQHEGAQAAIPQSAQAVSDSQAASTQASVALSDHLAKITDLQTAKALADKAIPGAERAVLSQTKGAMDPTQILLTARDLAEHTIRGAVAVENDVMDPAEYQKVIADPQFPAALQAFQDRLGGYMRSSHLSNQGVETDALGPTGQHVPLVREELPAGGGKPKSPYGVRDNKANTFSTGVGNYTTDPALVSDEIARRFSRNSEANLVQSMYDKGILQPTDALAGTVSTVMLGDRPMDAESVQIRDPLLVGGQWIKGQNVLVPSMLKSELDPILSWGKPMGKFGQAVATVGQGLSKLQVAGPREAIAHAIGLLRTSLAMTPGRTGAMGGVQSAVLPWFGAGVVRDAIGLDFKSPEVAQTLNRIAKAGAVPDQTTARFVSGTEEAARSPIGKALHAPKDWVFGPTGLDTRLRVVAAQRALSLDPGMSNIQLGRFLDHWGTYTKSLSSELERSLKGSGVAPFATSSKTRIVNGVKAVTGLTPTAGEGAVGQRLNLFARNVAGPVGMWVLGNKLVTGKWPWEDEDAKFLQIHLGDHYVNFNPLSAAGQGARGLGIEGEYNALKAGALPAVAGSLGAQDSLNMAASPLESSPLIGTLFHAAGLDPYASLVGSSGEGGLSFMPATPSHGSGIGETASANLLASLKGLNPGIHALLRYGLHAPEPDYIEKRDEPHSRLEQIGQEGAETFLPGLTNESKSPADKARFMARVNRRASR